MKKFIAYRIIGLAALYCALFCVLVILQFSNKGNFSLQAGLMTVRGRFLQNDEAAAPGKEKASHLEGTLADGVKIFFSGIEFNLKEARGSGLTLTDLNGSSIEVNPQIMTIDENTVRLKLGESAVVFTSSTSANGEELQIRGEFADNITSVSIPIEPRRSSIIHENEQIGVLYSGSRYFFSSSNGHEFEDGMLTLSRDDTFALLRSKEKQSEFNPDDFTIPQAQNYAAALSNWRESSFAYWNQNSISLQNEDDIIAFCGEALRRGSFIAALTSISPDFMNSARRTYRSSGFLGGMAESYRSFISAGNDKTTLLNRLAREGSPDILLEEHIIDYLFSRGNNTLAIDIINLIKSTTPENWLVSHCAGLLEAYVDIKLWRTELDNPVEPLIEQILLLVQENLNKDTTNNLVYVSGSEDDNSQDKNIEYSLRLGSALLHWAELANNFDWINIGHSLILSALTNSSEPAVQAAGIKGKLYNALRFTDYYPRAVRLADNGLWAWTIASSARAAYTDGNLNLSFSFPVSMTHHVIIRGIRPFIKLQIHEMDWRSDSRFERYDASGWVYYPESQTLILKLRHRTAVESVKIFYVPEAPPRAPVTVIEEAVETPQASGQTGGTVNVGG